MPESPRLPWRLVALSTVLALGAAVGTYVLLADDDSTGTPLELIPQGDVPTPDEATFTTFDGDVVALSSLRGTPTIVNFFASSCVPCATEMPEFEKVHQDLGTQVTFLGLAVAADPPDDAEALVERTGVTYRTAQDDDGSVISALGGTVLPTTVLLNAAGDVVARRSGEMTADELRQLLVDELGITS